jgi:hypothetical protein
MPGSREQFWTNLEVICSSPAHGPASKWRATRLMIFNQVVFELTDAPDTEGTRDRMDTLYDQLRTEAHQRGLR